MLSKSAITLFENSIEAITKDASTEHSRLSQIAREVISYPIKAIAAFLTAPILVIRVALTVKDPIRRIVAVTGLLFAIALSYVAGTLLGTFAGFLLIASSVGFLTAIGFLVGSMLSVILSVTFSIFVFNSVSFIFLKMSSQEVLEYLQDISR